jgi:hypothetical protein
MQQNLFDDHIVGARGENCLSGAMREKEENW